MKITDRTKKNEVKSESLKCGEIFRFDDCYYLATTIITGKDHFIYNCVNLENGKLCSLDGDDMVKVVEVEMIVN